MINSRPKLSNIKWRPKLTLMFLKLLLLPLNPRKCIGQQKKRAYPEQDLLCRKIMRPLWYKVNEQCTACSSIQAAQIAWVLSNKYMYVFPYTNFPPPMLKKKWTAFWHEETKVNFHSIIKTSFLKVSLLSFTTKVAYCG